MRLALAIRARFVKAIRVRASKNHCVRTRTCEYAPLCQLALVHEVMQHLFRRTHTTTRFELIGAHSSRPRYKAITSCVLALIAIAVSVYVDVVAVDHLTRSNGLENAK